MTRRPLRFRLASWTSWRMFAACAAGLTAFATSADARAMRCSIVTAAGLSFGTYDVFSSIPLDTTGSLSYTCRDGSTGDMIRIYLSRGTGSSFSPRAMRAGRFQLDYDVYLDPARTLLWADGTLGSGFYVASPPPEGATETVNLFARIPPRQNVGPGVYSDRLIVTVVF